MFAFIMMGIINTTWTVAMAVKTFGYSNSVYFKDKAGLKEIWLGAMTLLATAYKFRFW